MSLIKAYKKESIDFDNSKKTFLDIIGTMGDKPQEDDLLYLLQLYTEVSIGYIIDAAKTLEPNTKVKDSMGIMNSYIVEITTALGLKYYHKLEGYSIVDKCIQEQLTRDELSRETVKEFIDLIQESYIEDEEEIQE